MGHGSGCQGSQDELDKGSELVTQQIDQGAKRFSGNSRNINNCDFDRAGMNGIFRIGLC